MADRTHTARIGDEAGPGVHAVGPVVGVDQIEHGATDDLVRSHPQHHLDGGRGLEHHPFGADARSGSRPMTGPTSGVRLVSRHQRGSPLRLSSACAAGLQAAGGKWSGPGEAATTGAIASMASCWTTMYEASQRSRRASRSSQIWSTEPISAWG